MPDSPVALLLVRLLLKSVDELCGCSLQPAASNMQQAPAPVDEFAVLVKTIFLFDLIAHGMRVFDVVGDEDALSVVPWTGADTLTSINSGNELRRIA